MLSVNPETVRFIIDKAQAFHAKEALSIPEDPDGPLDDDWATQVLTDHADDPARAEIMAAVEDLEPDQQVMLVALMWLGRGDYSMVEWDAALAHAEDSWNEHSADYLIGTAMLGEYFSEGLQQFETEAAEEE